MKKDKTVRLVLTSPKLPELKIPEEYMKDPMLRLIYSIYVVVRENISFFEDYLYVEESVVNTDSKSYNILNNLGRISKSGYITNDGSSDITVAINGKDAITLKPGEVLSWGKNAYKLAVKRIVVKTESTSSQSFRLLAV